MEFRDPEACDNGGAEARAESKERTKSGPGGGADEALRRLEERLDRASDAAERLFSEARSAARPTPPQGGWQTPADDAEATGRGEFELLIGAVGALRERIPADLQRRLAEALRELLLVLRALIDWYLERSERRRAERDEVQDIPIL